MEQDKARRQAKEVREVTEADMMLRTPSEAAAKTFRRKPYEIPKADLVTGSVTEYIAGKYGIKEVDDGRGQTQTQIPDDRRP